MDMLLLWLVSLSAVSFFANLAMAGGYFIAKAREKALIIGAEREARQCADDVLKLKKDLASIEGKVLSAHGKIDAVDESLHALNAKIAARSKAEMAALKKAEKEAQIREELEASGQMNLVDIAGYQQNQQNQNTGFPLIPGKRRTSKFQRSA